MQIPSRIQKIEHPILVDAGVELFLKREDEIHPVISGNKWRKLKYNMKEIAENGRKGFVTFGGAFSNHLAAAAYAGFLARIEMVGIVRGEEIDLNNKTLRFVQDCGMKLKRIPRSEYARKEEREFLEQIKREFPDKLIIPEGGANLNGVKGCMEISTEVGESFDFIASPMGSATTFSGLILSSKPDTKVLGFPAVKGGDYLRDPVYNFIAQAKSSDLLASTFVLPDWKIQSEYHFGGFGKVTAELIQFMNDFWKETSVPLDPVYTGKMIFGIFDLAKKGEFKKGTKILALHTGGLQGISGMNKRLQNKAYKIEYEKNIITAFPDPRH